MRDPRERLVVLSRDHLPLPLSLLVLRGLARVAAPLAERDVVKRAAGLEGPALRDWSRLAWWGREANRAVRVRLDDPERAVSVERLIDVSPETRTALSESRLLVGGHVGPGQAAAHVVARAHPETLFAFWNAHPGLRAREYLMKDEAARRLSLAAFAAELRSGGRLFLTADGGWHREALELPFLSGRIRLGRGLPRLARRAGVAARPIAASWRHGRIEIRVGAPLRPEATPDEDWDRAWLRGYLDFFEPLLREPRNHRLERYGLWESFVATNPPA